MPAPAKASLDEIVSKRQFTAKDGPNGKPILTKLYKAPATWNSETRSAKFVMSAEVTDRYGDIVVAKGIKLDDFNNNPVVLWAHNSRNAPIGMWSDVKYVGGQPKRLEGVANLAPVETTDQADEIARLLEAGMVRACSIGFMPLEWEAVDKEDPWGGYKFIESDLWECSICSIPANPAALVKAAGGDTGAALQAIELVLDEWTRTPAGTIVPRSAFEKAYRVEKKADAPTLVEVKAIEEEPAAPATEKAPALDVKSFVREILDGIGEAVSKAVGKSKPAAEPALDAETVTNINKAADQEAEADVATAAEETAAAEQKRLDEEKAAAEKAAAEEEELALRARVLLLASTS